MFWFGAVQPNCSEAVEETGYLKVYRTKHFLLCWRTMGATDGQAELSAPGDEEGFALMQHHRRYSR